MKQTVPPPTEAIIREHADKPMRAAGLPVTPLAGVLIVVAIYLCSMILGQILLSTYPLARGLSGAAADSFTRSLGSQFAYVVVVEALTLGLLYMVMRGRRISFRTLGLLRYRLRDLGATLLAYPPYFVLNAAASLTAVALFHLNTSQPQQLGFDSAKTAVDLTLTFVSLVLLPPIVEEIVMRGFLFGSLKSGMSVVRAALLTSAIFALAHLQFGSGAPLLWLAAIDTFILSLVLCYLRQRTGSLWAGIGLHMLKNGLAFTALYLVPHLHYSF